MEHSTLRLILLVCGILLIIGIFIFDKIKQKRKLQQSTEYQPLLAEKQAEIKNIDDELDRLSANQSQVEETTTETESSATELILQIYIIPKEGEINGMDIEEATQELEFIPSKSVGLYDRCLGDSKTILYSMANLAKPNTFPLDNMADFNCPGMVLFGRLPHPQDGNALYSDMLFNARQLAKQWNAELQDETFSDLTKQRIDHTCEQIHDFQRKMEINKKRALD